MTDSAKNTADAWLDKLDAEVAKLRADSDFCCSQTVLAIGMKRLGINDPDLLRAMGGFCGGSCAGVCGALAGGAALLGLYLGQGTPDADRDQRLKKLTMALTETFRAYWKDTQCDGLVHNDPKLRKTLCPTLMSGTVEMVWEILRENGVSLDARGAR